MKTIFLILFIWIFSGFAPAQDAGTRADTSTFTPIVDMKLKGLLGGSKDGKWVKVSKAAALFRANTEFVLIDENRIEEGGVTVGNKQLPQAPCEEFYLVEFDLDTDTGIAAGSNAAWNFLPRAPQKIDNKNEAYKKIVKAFLAKKGLTKTSAQIQQIFRADLEGDRQDEVIISGTYYKNGVSPVAAVGDYSFVLIRKIAGKNIKEIVLEGEFYEKAVESGAPNSYRISAIADLNGDGKMEVVVYGSYYEGSFSSVYEINGTKATNVLEAGCGV